VAEVAPEPYVTFSADLIFAFVEQTHQTARAEQAVAWLDARLRGEERLLVPTMTDWSPALARVVSLEVWDEHGGTRVEHAAPGARVLWAGGRRGPGQRRVGRPDVDDNEGSLCSLARTRILG